jgi:hypothetical protein
MADCGEEKVVAGEGSEERRSRGKRSMERSQE